MASSSATSRPSASKARRASGGAAPGGRGAGAGTGDRAGARGGCTGGGGEAPCRGEARGGRVTDAAPGGLVGTSKHLILTRSAAEGQPTRNDPDQSRQQHVDALASTADASMNRCGSGIAPMRRWWAADKAHILAVEAKDDPAVGRRTIRAVEAKLTSLRPRRR